MSDSSRRIRYLRDCYVADTGGGGIYNLFDRKIEHCRFFSKDRLLAGALRRLPMTDDRGAQLARAAGLYRREKHLLYMAFPIVGKPVAERWQSKVLCAPLLAYPAELTRQDHGLALRLDAQDPQLNVPALAALIGGGDSARIAVESLLGQLPEPPLRWEEIFDLVQLLQEAIPELRAEQLHRFPELHSRQQVRKAVQDAKGGKGVGLCCLPACALGLVPRSLETRGILSGLKTLAETQQRSRPLRTLLGADDPGAQPVTPPSELLDSSGYGSEATSRAGHRAARPGDRIPAVLSAAQIQALEASAEHSLTLLIGPPGTGKSFTLAALALDHVSRGESVLIAARRDQAVTVIEGKLEEFLGGESFALRAGRRAHLRKLKGELRALLHGADPLRGLPIGRTEPIERELRELDDQLAELERHLGKRGALEERWGRIETDDGSGLAGLWLAIKQRMSRRSLDRMPAYWQLLSYYGRGLDRRSARAAERLWAGLRDQVHSTLRRHRRDLSQYLKGLKARHSARQEAIFQNIDHKVLLKTFPLWTATFAGAYRAIPQISELFDLVIVDEATQCDMASGLPVFDLGKRLVVSGDPRQLRHVSFLSGSHQRHEHSEKRVAKKHGSPLSLETGCR